MHKLDKKSSWENKFFFGLETGKKVQTFVGGDYQCSE